MKESKGIPHRIDSPQVRRITLSPRTHRRERDDTALICNADRTPDEGFCITSSQGDGRVAGLYGVSGDFLSLLREGDIAKITPDGQISLLWETSSRHNPIFLTDCCNSRCIMCPQTPEKNPRHHDEEAKRMLRLLQLSEPPAFGITGGEPTLALDGLVDILEICRKRFPGASVQLLTNGRRFADFQVATRVAERSSSGILFCIPVFADNDVQHDEITGVAGSFSETITGIHNLVRYRRAIEIRVVIVRQNAARLRDLAHFIFWNFPFAVHIAFMAMETSGSACTNLDQVWVEPAQYRQELEKAVLFLHQRVMKVSIYNLPHCLLSERFRPFARDSISDWKKTYVPECEGCSRKESCGGFFATSVRKPADIHPL
ncbi:MAG: His-Xaa-Ser system radical SAM maturase HxsC [Candidatus Xenobiia bacterium LiM19]